jgi:hypothetical protein
LRFSGITARTLCSNGVSDHPVLKDSSPNPYCLHLQECRMNHCFTVGSSDAKAPALARLCLDSNEASDRSTVSTLRPSDHLMLLSSLLLCNSSNATRKLTVGSSDGALVFTQCTNSSDHFTDACYLGTIGSSDDVFSFSFLCSVLTLE